MSDTQNPQASPQPQPPGYTGYALPGYPGQQTAATPAPGKALARAALIIAIAAMLLAFAGSMTVQLMSRSRDLFAVVGVVSSGQLVLSFLLNATALILGLIALRRPISKGVAGIATGIAIAGLFGILIALTTMLMVVVVPYN
ncbi:MAG: hypothetical protein LBU78_08450 [Microbacterium sp.]|nr:hypothetical protein [Microbacterium sp.]